MSFVFWMLIFCTLDTHTHTHTKPHPTFCCLKLFSQDLQQSVFNAEMIEEQSFEVNMVSHIKHISTNTKQTPFTFAGSSYTSFGEIPFDAGSGVEPGAIWNLIAFASRADFSVSFVCHICRETQGQKGNRLACIQTSFDSSLTFHFFHLSLFIWRCHFSSATFFL